VTPIKITLYKNLYKNLPWAVREMSWDEFVEGYIELKWLDKVAEKGINYSDKAQLPLWSPLTLKKGTVRSNENVDKIYCLCLDFDEGAAVEDVEAVWGNYLMVTHTTWSNKPGEDRTRAVVCLSRPVTVREFKTLIKWAMRYSEDAGLIPDPACKDAARMWYLPAPAPEFRDNYHWSGYYEGDEPPVDVDLILRGGKQEIAPEQEEDHEFINMEGEHLQIKEWGLKHKRGDKIKGACPFKEGSSLGSAFLRRCKDGVLLCCMSKSHGHARSPFTQFFPFANSTQLPGGREEGGPEEAVLTIVEQDTVRGMPTGRPKATPSNLAYVLEHDTRWNQRIWKNGFNGDVMLDAAVRWTDVEDTKLAVWLDRVYGKVWATNVVRQTVEMHAAERVRNPLQEWLGGLVWDGEKRVDEWLVKGFSSDDTAITRILGRKWLIQAVARCMRPGCQADATLVLVGPQGAGKSTGLRVLAGDEYFSDTPLDFSKDAFQQIRKAWIYEIAELDSFRGRAHSQIKAFLTASSDTYREPYKTKAEVVPRHVVFAASTNEEGFLTDSTGSRRFWPVRTDWVDRKWLTEFRGMLWAEAYDAFAKGERWHLTAAEEQALRDVHQPFQVNDAWEELISKWTAAIGHDQFTIERVMAEGLELQPYQMDKGKQMRVAETLRRLGFEQRREYVEGRRRRVWARAAVGLEETGE